MRCCLLLLLTSIVSAQSVEVIRDEWGVPHVFADTDAGAFYGLGYASARDRGFQMHYLLRIVHTLLRGVDRAEGPDTLTHHRDPRETNALHFRVTDTNALRLPTIAVALDVDVAVSIPSPRMHGKDESVARVAVLHLELPTNVPSEQVARNV